MPNADRYLYLDAEKKRVLEYGDLEAAYMFCNPGSEVHELEMDRYGLTWKDGCIVLPKEGAKTPASAGDAYDPRSEPAAQAPEPKSTEPVEAEAPAASETVTKTEPAKAPKKHK